MVHIEKRWFLWVTTACKSCRIFSSDDDLLEIPDLEGLKIAGDDDNSSQFSTDDDSKEEISDQNNIIQSDDGSDLILARF